VGVFPERDAVDEGVQRHLVAPNERGNADNTTERRAVRIHIMLPTEAAQRHAEALSKRLVIIDNESDDLIA
jgi:hypothetical protein